MAVVAGVDFGTLSVRVTLLDSDRGRLGTASAGYPLHRRREDPNFATQSAVSTQGLRITFTKPFGGRTFRLVELKAFAPDPSIPQRGAGVTAAIPSRDVT
jgi:hypothetical protein